jgi:hypothetical protein
MKDWFWIGFKICGGAGMVASLVVAFCPCWVLIKSQSKAGRIIWKLLGFLAFWGWLAFFGEMSRRFGLGDFGTLVGIVITGCLIFTAASRGEQVARLQGRIEGQVEDRKGIRYITKR